MTGGYGGMDMDGYYGDWLSSTELLTKGTNEWRIIPNSLPVRLDDLRSISFNNQIITTGQLFLEAV